MEEEGGGEREACESKGINMFRYIEILRKKYYNTRCT